jgi:16S rRNA processing protein RimM
VDQPDDWVAVGSIVGTFGVHGQLKVEPLTDVPDRFEQLPAVYLGDERRKLRVEGAHPHKRQILLQLEGIADMTAAERLRGQLLWIPAAEIAPLPPDQYYIHDLLGQRVEHVNGKALGRVTDVLTGTGNDLLVVRNDETGAETLVPAAKAFIKSVDLAAGVLRLDPIPGLFDDEAVVDDGEPET